MATCIAVVRREYTEQTPLEAIGLVASAVEVNGVYNVAKIGAVVARSTNTTAGTNVAFRLTGQYSCIVDTGVTIAVGDKIYYNSATDRVTNTKPTSGFFFGRAVTVSSSYNDGNSTAGVAAGTVVADVIQVTTPGGGFHYLASGATCSDLVIASGTANLTGTGNLETIAVTGALSTDAVFAILKTNGSNATVGIVGARIPTDGSVQITVGLAGGTGSGAVAQYWVTRASS